MLQPVAMLPTPSALGAGRLAGKTAIITGGAGGMGLAASRLFARQGAKVTVLDIDRAAGEALEAEMQADGLPLRFLNTDCSKAAAVAEALDQAESFHGPIDVLFNHAGSIVVKPFHETTEAEYDRLMDINVRSAFLVCRDVVSRMLRGGRGGSIVITSSIGGEKGFALEALYCMTKGAVLQLARSICAEYRMQGIRANALCPGFVRTNHGVNEIKALDSLGQNWNEGDLVSAQTRICEPEEVAAAALFLASDEASFINGAALYVDGGWYAKG